MRAGSARHRVVAPCLLTGLSALAGGLLPACVGEVPVPDANPGVVVAAPGVTPTGAVVVDQFILHVRPRAGTMVVERVSATARRQAGLSPQSLDNLPVIEDGVTGSGPASTVELDTTVVDNDAACPGYAGSPIFCGHVILDQFYPQSINNVYAQVTAITDVNGAAMTGHDAVNSDPAPSLTGYTIDATHGLWKYTAPGAAAGVIGSAPSNSAARDWSFANPDNADTNILLRVVATLKYRDYARTTSTQAFLDACALTGATSGAPTSANVTATLPFPFTFYGVQAAPTLLYNRDGVFTFTGTKPPSGSNTPFKSVLLPEGTASLSASPGGYIFWDALNYNPGGKLCHAVSGSAPRRQFVVTWKNMRAYGSANNAENLTFSAIFSEGTNTIDYVYSSMIGSNAANTLRAGGKKAIVGVEGPSSSGGGNISTPFPAGAGATSTTTGAKYQFSPIP